MNRPYRIGITACMLHEDPERVLFNGRQLQYLETSMAHYVCRAGALPYMLPAIIEPMRYEQLLDGVDAIILHGGSDVCPLSYGEDPLRPEWSGDVQRDQFELALIDAARALDKPILGICRGAQILNVAFGGTLYQDINTQRPGTLTHRDAQTYQRNHHEVTFAPESTLAALYQTTSGRINSVHHQAVKTLADELVLEAWCTEDQTVEAFRLPAQAPNDPFIRGVQWHPEFQSVDETSLLDPMPLLDELFEAIEARQHNN